MDISTPNLNKPFTPPVPQRKEPLGSFSGTAVKRPSGTFNWFGALSFIIFFGVVCWWAGLYGYQYILKKEKADIEAQIANLAKGFQIVTFDNLEALGNRLSFAQNIIDKHTALLPLLCFLEKNTLTKSVSYNGLTYSADGDQEGPLKLTLLGRANSFASLAYQAKVYIAIPTGIQNSHAKIIPKMLGSFISFFSIAKAGQAHYPSITLPCFHGLFSQLLRM
jgi:hypothetical protein